MFPARASVRAPRRECCYATDEFRVALTRTNLLGSGFTLQPSYRVWLPELPPGSASLNRARRDGRVAATCPWRMTCSLRDSLAFDLFCLLSSSVPRPCFSRRRFLPRASLVGTSRSLV